MERDPTQTLTVEFDGAAIDVTVPSPRGWEVESVDPMGCSWASEDGEHIASHYYDDMDGGTTLKIDGEVVGRDLSKQEAAARLTEFDPDDPTTWPTHPSNTSEEDEDA